MSFILVVTLIFLNLFIAIILQGFSSSNSRANLLIKDEVLKQFVDKWSKYDPYATGFIAIEDFRLLLDELDPPFGFEVNQDELEKSDYVDSLQLATFEKLSKYNFFDVLSNMTKRIIMANQMNKSSNVLEETEKEERLQNLIKELNFENQKEEIAVVVELMKRNNKITKKLYKKRDFFSSTVLKAAMIFKRKLKHIRDRQNNIKSPKVINSDGKDVLLIVKEELSNEESSSLKSSKSSLLNSKMKQSPNAKLPGILINNKQRKQKRNKKSTKKNKKKKPKGSKVMLFEDNTSMGGAQLLNTLSNMDNFSKSVTNANLSVRDLFPGNISGAIQRNSICDSSQRDSKINVNEWSDDPSIHAFDFRKQNTIQLAEHFINEGVRDSNDQYGENTKIQGNPQVPDSNESRQSIEVSHEQPSPIPLIPSFDPNSTFMIPISSSRNIPTNRQIVGPDKKEIMGNSWIKSFDQIDKQNTLKNENSRIILEELKNDLPDIEKQINMKVKMSDVHQQNLDYDPDEESKVLNLVLKTESKSKETSGGVAPNSIKSKLNESSSIHNRSRTSLAKTPAISSEDQLSISSFSQEEANAEV